MNHIGTKVLETRRLILRPIEDKDATALYDMLGDAEVVKYLRVPRYDSLACAEGFIQSIKTRYSLHPDTYFWAIARKETDGLIGTIVLGTLHEGDEVAETAFSLARAYWRNGYMTETLKAVLAFGLREAGYNRIEAVHATGNPASGAAMRSAGMLYEGMCREKYKNYLGYHDSHMYAILKKDLV